MPTLIENFKKGDLLYGLNFHRLQLIEDLKDKVGSDVAVTIDEYNSLIIHRFVEIDDMNEAKFREIQEQLEIDLNDDSNEARRPIKNEFLKSHYQFLLNASYQKVRLTSQIPPINIKKMGEEQRRTRKACKARMLDKEITIHFVLDGINLQHSFDREFSLANASQFQMKDLQCPYDSYTAAELRFAFKHYEEIKDNIKFYYRDQEIDLFKWLSDHSTAAIKALENWIDEKIKEKKLHPDFKIELQKAYSEKQIMDTSSSAPSEAMPASEASDDRENQSTLKRKKTDETCRSDSPERVIKKTKIFVPPPTPQIQVLKQRPHEKISSVRRTLF